MMSTLEQRLTVVEDSRRPLQVMRAWGAMVTKTRGVSGETDGGRRLCEPALSLCEPFHQPPLDRRESTRRIQFALACTLRSIVARPAERTSKFVVVASAARGR